MIKSLTLVKNKVINVALVGCGRISQNHIKSIAICNDQAKLVAICDNQEERLENAEKYFYECLEVNRANRYIPKKFKNYSEMIKSCSSGEISIDLIVLATPSGLHPNQVIEAAKAKIHVCTEKPMATNWEDGIAMVNECDKSNVHLFVVKQNRFNKTLQLVKKQLEKGRFGKLAMVTMNVFWHRPQKYYDQDKWRGTWTLDGGALMNQASHYVDLLDWLIGPVASINASLATISRNIEVEDTAALQIDWKNGALGTMAVTMLTFPKNLEGSITILGDKGTVRVGGQAVNKIEQWQFADEDEDDQKIEEASYSTTSVYGFGHPPYYKNMLDTLHGKDKAICNGYDGLKSLELLVAAYRSAKEKQRIYLPL